MRILYLLEGHNDGGGPIATRNLAKLISTKIGKNQVAVFGPKEEQTKSDEYLLYPNTGIRRFSFQFFKRLKNSIKSFNPQIVHASGLFLCLLALFYKLHMKSDFKLLLTVHTTNSKSSYHQISRLLIRYLAKTLDGVTFLTSHQKEHYCKELAFCPKNTEIIPNIIPEREISEKTIERIRTTLLRQLACDYLVIYAGRIVPLKQIDIFIKTLKILNQKKLSVGGVIIGDGPQKHVETLKKLAETSGINKKIIFTGFKNSPQNYISACDCVLFPTKQETLPNLLVESFSLGKPVVVSDIPHLKELAIHRENAFVVPGNDPIKYAEALFSLFLNENIRKKIAIGGKETFKIRFSPNLVYIKYLDFYRQFLK
ncbi:MAG: glycosyltransferase family 4 protein [Prolixibacteraceae bacterium]|nr:glycosyltransferase family 4 protein [Prolixibacteraceae bacterium]